MRILIYTMLVIVSSISITSPDLVCIDATRGPESAPVVANPVPVEIAPVQNVAPALPMIIPDLRLLSGRGRVLPECTAEEFKTRALKSAGRLFYDAFGEWPETGKRPGYIIKNQEGEGQRITETTNLDAFDAGHNTIGVITSGDRYLTGDPKLSGNRHLVKLCVQTKTPPITSAALDFYNPAEEFDAFCAQHGHHVELVIYYIHHGGFSPITYSQETEFDPARSKEIIEWMQNPENHDTLESALITGSFSSYGTRTALRCLLTKAGIPVSNGIIQKTIDELIRDFKDNMRDYAVLSEAEQERRIRDLHALLS